MSGTWSSLLEEALGPSRADARVERLTVRPGEVLARVRDGGTGGGGGGGRAREVSLIRTVLPEAEWVRACAALASQPVFRARLLAGELPVAAARVFALLGLDLVPRGWADLVAACSCDQWRGRCAHLAAAVAALGEEADRDPFVLTRWLGRERRALVARVSAHSTATTNGPSGEAVIFGEKTGSPGINAGESPPLSPGGASARVAPTSAFWSTPRLPSPPRFPEGTADRVRAAAPGAFVDELPLFAHREDAQSETE